jgi:3-demethoxyubiquinol 3-hydroxylase
MSRSTATDTALGARILKVNHAGEHGAVSIYTGQIAAAHFTAASMVEELRVFKSHEVRHRTVFAAELARRGAPRCVSYWLCALGGLTLGFVTGLLGKQAIAATTVAVERVVLEHLKHQLSALGPDIHAKQAVLSIVAEEQEHHDRSANQSAAGSFWPKVLGPIVAASTQSVIWLGMHL